MADAAYNSPYTGAQLDETIRKITSNKIHTYVEVFDSHMGTNKGIQLSSLPLNPQGNRNGVYDVEFASAGSTQTAMDGASVSRLYIHDTGIRASGSGHVGMWMDGTKMYIAEIRAYYDEADGKIKINYQIADIQKNSIHDNAAYGKIFKISRQDTIN